MHQQLFSCWRETYVSVQYFNHYLARVVAGRTSGLTDQYFLNDEPEFLGQKKSRVQIGKDLN